MRTKLNDTQQIIIPGYINVKTLKITLNTKHRTEKLKTNKQRYKNTQNQNTDRRKSSFTKTMCRKCRLYKTCIEQNSNHTQKMNKIPFRSSKVRNPKVGKNK